MRSPLRSSGWYGTDLPACPNRENLPYRGYKTANPYMVGFREIVAENLIWIRQDLLH